MTVGRPSIRTTESTSPDDWRTSATSDSLTGTPLGAGDKDPSEVGQGLSGARATLKMYSRPARRTRSAGGRDGADERCIHLEGPDAEGRKPGLVEDDADLRVRSSGNLYRGDAAVTIPGRTPAAP